MALAAWWAVRPVPVAPAEPPVLWHFDDEELAAIRLRRPDGAIEIVKEGGRWRVEGAPWRPRASMVRRVAHQLHHLVARARVAERVDDPARYGLDEGAVRVELELSDGAVHRLAVGGPNPTGVSWYVQVPPGGPVYVVPRAAVDYLRLDRDAFREDRIAWFDPAEATAVEGEVDGRPFAFRRTGPRRWEMLRPERGPADRRVVDGVLGAIGAMRAARFVADRPDDPSRWGVGPGGDAVRVVLSTGDAVALRFGDAVPGSDPPLRYAHHLGDDAVYAVRAGVLDPLRRPVAEWLDRRLIDAAPGDVRGVVATRGERAVEIRRTAGGWRWRDGGEVPGNTPERLVDAATALDGAPSDDAPWTPDTALDLDLGDRGVVRIALRGGTRARVEGRPGTWTVGPALSAEIDALFRAWERRVDRRSGRR